MCAYKKIDTVCPYCGTGCVITCTVDTEKNRSSKPRARRAVSTMKAGSV